MGGLYRGPVSSPGRAYDYFAVNQRGLATSYRVSGRLGECAAKRALHGEAVDLCRLLNRAYRLGLRHGLSGINRETPFATPNSHKEKDR